MSDRYYGTNVLLLDFAGTGGGSTFVDKSPMPKTIVVNGTPTISDTVTVNGAQSGYFPGSSYLRIQKLTGDATFSEMSNFNLYNQDFTLDVMLYQTATPNGSTILTTQYPSNVMFALGYDNSILTGAGAKPFFGFYDGSWHGIIHATALSNNEWHHIVVERFNDVISLYVDGEFSASMVWTGNLPIDGNDVFLGRRWDSDNFFQGYLAQVRLTKFVARYKGAVSVPVAPFSTEPLAGEITHGAISSAVTQSNDYGYTKYAFFDYTNNTLPHHEHFFGQTASLGALRYAYGTAPRALPSSSKIVEFDKDWTMFHIDARESALADEKCDTIYDFLDDYDDVLFTIRLLKDGTYRHGMWYGTNPSSLTKAGQTGANPRTYGFLKFYSDGEVKHIKFVVPANVTSDINHAWDVEVDYTQFKRLKITTDILSSWVGNASESAVSRSMLNLLSTTPTDVYEIRGTVLDVSGNYASRNVLVYRRDNGVLLSSLMSDPTTGEYAFESSSQVEAFVVCLPAIDENVNAKILDKITAELTAGGGTSPLPEFSTNLMTNGSFSSSTAIALIGNVDARLNDTIALSPTDPSGTAYGYAAGVGNANTGAGVAVTFTSPKKVGKIGISCYGQEMFDCSFEFSAYVSGAWQVVDTQKNKTGYGVNYFYLNLDAAIESTEWRFKITGLVTMDKAFHLGEVEMYEVVV